MFRGFLVLTLLLGCIAPLRAQEDHELPFTQFSLFPPCETEVLDAYAEEILPYMWMVYLVEPTDIPDPDWVRKASLNGLFILGAAMPVCREAAQLRSLATGVMYYMALAQVALYGNAETVESMMRFADGLVDASMWLVPNVYEDSATLHKRMAEILAAEGSDE